MDEPAVIADAVPREVAQHFCQNCHRNFKQHCPHCCPHCGSAEIMETAGACHVPGCPYPKLNDSDLCEGHTR